MKFEGVMFKDNVEKFTKEIQVGRACTPEETAKKCVTTEAVGPV